MERCQGGKGRRTGLGENEGCRKDRKSCWTGAVIRAAMEERHEEARLKPRVVDDSEDRLVAHTGASLDLDACQMQEELELRIGD